MVQVYALSLLPVTSSPVRRFTMSAMSLPEVRRKFLARRHSDTYLGLLSRPQHGLQGRSQHTSTQHADGVPTWAKGSGMALRVPGAHSTHSTPSLAGASPADGRAAPVDGGGGGGGGGDEAGAISAIR